MAGVNDIWNGKLLVGPTSDDNHSGCNPSIIQSEVVITTILKVSFDFYLQPKYHPAPNSELGSVHASQKTK